MAVRKPGVYVALSANYADDEAIMDAGEDAELLYIRMLAYCARTPLTEGWISDRVVLSRLGVMPRLAGNGAGNEPGTDAGSRAARLCEVGLIHRDDDGYRITSWLKWNRSVEEMGRERARDAERKKPVTSGNAKRQSGTGAGKRAGNDAGLPDASPLSDQIRSDTDQIKSKTEQSAPEPPAKPTRLPDDWEPSETHRTRAAEEGLDVDREAVKFRSYYEATDKKMVRWNAAFTTWLIKGGEYAKRDAGKPARSMDRQGDLLREEMARARAADAAREGRLEIEGV